MKYKIADIIVEMTPQGRLIHQAEQYKIENDELADFEVSLGNTEDYKKRNLECDYETYQYVISGGNFCRELLNYNGIFMHASAVVVDGNAYLFSAPSGTGKSTHTGLWLEKFGDKAFIINDDKPAIREIEGEFYVYGTPWSGKTDTSVNTRAKLKGICFIERDKINRIEKITSADAFPRIMHATLKKHTEGQLNKMLDTINSLLTEIPIFFMGCTPTLDAADMAYEAMSK